MDMCFFNHPFRLQHYVYSNDHKLLNNCVEIYHHDRRQHCKNRCPPHDDNASHGYFDGNPEKPDRRLPLAFVQTMIQYFTCSMQSQNIHYSDVLSTEFLPEKPSESYEEWMAHASQCEERSFREWLSLKYEESMDAFYDHPAHNHYNNGYDDNHIRNRPKTPPTDESLSSHDNNSENLDAESRDYESSQDQSNELQTSLVLPDAGVSDHGDGDVFAEEFV